MKESMTLSQMKKRIGLFGGTFNPIHIGHLKMAEAARKEYKLSYIYFIPCGIPPHKPNVETPHGASLLPAKLRYDLVKKAIKGKKYFKVLDIEIKKKTKAYTLDTVKKIVYLLSPRLQSGRGTPSAAIPYPLYFLIGQDEFEKLHTWKKVSELAKLLIFLVLPRGKQKKIKLPKIKNLKWHLVHTKPINISATSIRKNRKIKN